MKDTEYVKTIIVYGKMVNVGLDDYGQQYYLEFVNDQGELEEVGCGAYNFDYEDVAKSIIDHRRYQIEILGEETVIQLEKEKKEREQKWKSMENKN